MKIYVTKSKTETVSCRYDNEALEELVRDDVARRLNVPRGQIELSTDSDGLYSIRIVATYTQRTVDGSEIT
jgi:hypothetical protein